MAITIIVKNKLKSRGRSDYHKMLKAEGWGGAGMTDEQADKSEFLERKIYSEGFTRPTSLRTVDLEKE